MFICILGRQPLIGYAELQALYGDRVSLIAPTVALVKTQTIDGSRLGGVQKIAFLQTTFPSTNWRSVSEKVVKQLMPEISEKITLGISAYHFPVSARDVQKTGLVLKRRLKDKKSVNIRLVPNPLPALNTAQVMHNKLTHVRGRELVFVKSDDKTYFGETIYVQDIDAYTFRDRSRPRRDAYVGMLPPKLAQTMINLAARDWSLDTREVEAPVSEDFAFPAKSDKTKSPIASNESDETGASYLEQNSMRLLDPFCGTGVVLQEAALMGYGVYGTDISERMIRYTRDNLAWLTHTHKVYFDKYFHTADATEAVWQQPIDLVVGEGYLGKPFATTPDREALEAAVHESNAVMRGFFKNIAPQLTSGTTLCIAVPAWHIRGEVRHVPLLSELESFGFKRRSFVGITNADLVYAREDQVVGRELLVLTKV